MILYFLWYIFASTLVTRANALVCNLLTPENATIHCNDWDLQGSTCGTFSTVPTCKTTPCLRFSLIGHKACHTFYVDEDTTVHTEIKKFKLYTSGGALKVTFNDNFVDLLDDLIELPVIDPPKQKGTYSTYDNPVVSDVHTICFEETDSNEIYISRANITADAVSCPKKSRSRSASHRSRSKSHRSRSHSISHRSRSKSHRSRSRSESHKSVSHRSRSRSESHNSASHFSRSRSESHNSASHLSRSRSESHNSVSHRSRSRSESHMSASHRSRSLSESHMSASRRSRSRSDSLNTESMSLSRSRSTSVSSNTNCGSGVYTFYRGSNVTSVFVPECPAFFRVGVASLAPMSFEHLVGLSLTQPLGYYITSMNFTYYTQGSIGPAVYAAYSTACDHLIDATLAVQTMQTAAPPACINATGSGYMTYVSMEFTVPPHGENIDILFSPWSGNIYISQITYAVNNTDSGVIGPCNQGEFPLAACQCASTCK